MANPSVWKNAKNLRLVEWADKHLSSLPKEQPVDHAAVVFPRELVGASCLSVARACARGKGRSAVDPAGVVSLPER